MPIISDTSVLKALMALQGKTESGAPRVVTLPALAKHTGKTAASVKAILANNEAALSRDEKGRLIGAKVVTAARLLGLVVQSTKAVQGSCYFQTFRENTEVIGRFNLDDKKSKMAATHFEDELSTAGKIVCSVFSQLPVDVLTSTWQEDGLLPEIEPVSCKFRT